VNSPRRLTVGPIRDSVLEVELVTGDGRLVRGGARTVKNATGYDLPRLAAGSLGTLGAIVQVALRLRPKPKTRRTLVWRTDEPIDLGLRLLYGVPLPTAVLAAPQSVELRLEGWPEAVAEQADVALEVEARAEQIEGASFPVSAPWLDAPVVAEASTHPSGISAAVKHAGGRWGALLGVGIIWAGLPADGEALARLRAAVPFAPVIKGPGGLGAAPPALAIHRRLKESFDPARILAPGRFWKNA
jgi:glycolate oxidase FAD binding subunit